MAIKPNQVRYLTSQHDGVGPVLNDKDWFKNLFKKTLCSSATMKEYTATFSEYNAEDRTVKITTSGNSLYWTGQVIKLSGLSIPSLNDEYVVLEGHPPTSCIIRLPEGLTPTEDTFSVRLSGGQWTFEDVSSDITLFYPRDYIAGEDFYISLNTAPYANLTATTQGRACEVCVFLDVDGTPVNVTGSPSALFTRPRPSTQGPSNYASSQHDYRAWSLFFDHESFFFFSTVSYGLAMGGGVNSGYSAMWPVKQGGNPLPPISNWSAYANYSLQNMAGINTSNVIYEPDVCAYFTKVKPVSLYGELPIRERRLFGFPPEQMAKLNDPAYYSYDTNIPKGYANAIYGALTISGSDSRTIMPMPTDSTSVGVSASVATNGNAKSGAYPYHPTQAIGKNYAIVNHPTKGGRLGYLPALVGINSNINKMLFDPYQEIWGGSTAPSILGMPVERYTDDTALVAVCRGIAGGASFSGTQYTVGGGSSFWQGLHVGGEWSSD